MQASLIILAAAQLATAHFGVEYPEWRADTLAAEDGPYSQWDYPCANVPAGTGNRTEWPLNGGAVSLHLHHPWTYLFINLGLGENVTNFNISLTPQLLNVTGNGTFCLPSLSLPDGLAEGTNATLQFVTSGTSGSALYNCADVKLVANAAGPTSDVCVNTTQYATIVGQSTSTTASNTTNTTSGGTSTSKGSSAASAVSANIVALSGFVGMAVLFAVGMGI